MWRKKYKNKPNGRDGILKLKLKPGRSPILPLRNPQNFLKYSPTSSKIGQKTSFRVWEIWRLYLSSSKYINQVIWKYSKINQGYWLNSFVQIYLSTSKKIGWLVHVPNQQWVLTYCGSLLANSRKIRWFAHLRTKINNGNQVWAWRDVLAISYEGLAEQKRTPFGSFAPKC